MGQPPSGRGDDFPPDGGGDSGPTPKPHSPIVPAPLYTTLTKLNYPLRLPTALLVKLLQTLARTVYPAQRNAQQLYRLTARARDLCDHLNGILETLADENDDDHALRMIDVFMTMLKPLEQSVHSLKNLLRRMLISSFTDICIAFYSW